MKNLNQFILCNGKVPVAPEGHRVNAHDPANWMSHEAAKIAAAAMNWQVGFVITSADPYFLLDIDHHLDLATNEWSPLAQQLMNYLTGCCMELSQGGDGLHIFGSGTITQHSCKNTELGLEFYSKSRLVRLTSDLDNGDPNLDCSSQIAWMIENYFPPGTESDEDWRNSPILGWNGPTDDEELIRMARRPTKASEVFGG